jgi:protein-tyrosine-phosphatase
MAESGYDLSHHRSRAVSGEIVDQADLIVVMSHEHAIELAVVVPDAWSKFFQIRDFLRRVESTGSYRRGRPSAIWLEEVGSGRTRAGFLASNREDDIPDPVGQPLQQFERTKWLLDELFTKLAGFLS